MPIASDIQNPRSIKYYVNKFFNRESERFKGKRVVDFPAGNGFTTEILRDIGANPIPFDLFPEYFLIDGVKCDRANINEGIPLEGGSVDAIISQEGIEHFENQLLAFKEFNRLLANGGSLIVTTPNYSSLASKLSYLLSESERFNKGLAPNELDDVWMTQQDLTKEIYYGHIFLIGALKMRALAELAGFRVKHIEKTRAKSTSVLLLPLFYPFILLSSYLSYKKSLKKRIKKFGGVSDIEKSKYKEIFRFSKDLRLLVDSHLFVEFEKVCDVEDVASTLRSQHFEFNKT